MPDAQRPTFNVRFAEDLRRIREDRGISLETLHEETKIPPNLLAQFEETGLFDHPMFNRVYLRSLVRAYADVVGIDEEEALTGLDESLGGTYSNRLAATYLGEAPDVPDVEARPAEVSEEKAAPVPEKKPEAPTPVKPRPVVKTERAVKREVVSPPVPAWQAQSPPPSERSRPPVDIRDRRRSLQWIFISVVVVLFAASIWGVLAVLKRPEPAVSTSEEVAADTARGDTTAVAEAVSARPQVTIGDTLNVTVIAARGKLEGLRVTKDDDLRRPYWLELGNAQEFTAINRVVFENMLDRLRLIVEGYDYPTNLRDDQGRLVITRDGVTAFLDTVSGPPVDVQAVLRTLQPPRPPTP